MFFFVFVGMVGLYTEKSVKVNNLQKQAIELKHAEYNSQTGEWQWITNR